MSVWKVYVLHYSVNFFNKIYMILQSICNDTKMLVEEGKVYAIAAGQSFILRDHLPRAQSSSDKSLSLLGILPGPTRPQPQSWEPWTQGNVVPRPPWVQMPSCLTSTASHQVSQNQNSQGDAQYPGSHSLILKMGKLRPMVVRCLPRSHS